MLRRQPLNVLCTLRSPQRINILTCRHFGLTDTMLNDATTLNSHSDGTPLSPAGSSYRSEANNYRSPTIQDMSTLIEATEARPTAADYRQLNPLQNYRTVMRCIEPALLGHAVPKSLDLELVQRCVIRGIRYNDGFALGLRGVTPRFTRALNAQAIMNNRVPDMQNSEDFPYCIWHPNTPDEDTCRALVQRYPQMAYQVGRVCAVAGYFDLYRDLHLLPEVHMEFFLSMTQLSPNQSNTQFSTTMR
jgi:hypothetical protein